MNWYYAENGQQQGPFPDWDFANLARSGTIKPDTLVWRDGLPEWQPLRVLRPDLLTSSDAPKIGGVAVPEQQKDLLVQQMREGVVPGALPQAANPYGLRYAGFWIRLGAYLIDWIVLTVFNVTMAFLFVGSFSAAFKTGFDPEHMNRMNQDPSAMMAFVGMELAVSAISMLAQVIYFGVMVGKWGASLGKMAVGIRVVRADGSPVSMGLGFGRALACILNQFACGLTYLMIAFDETEKRGVQDHVCNTRVVYK